MYAEDMDWCYRFRKAGWQVRYIPNCRVVHLGGGSSHRLPAATVQRQLASSFMFIQKHAAFPLRGFALVQYAALLLEAGMRLFVAPLMRKRTA